jgi:predicted O-methyltransferase YrrM
VERHDFLTVVHERYRPRSYLEIGVFEGHGLARSRTQTIGVDPDFRITAELACELQLVRTTSDEFFARPDPLAWFPGGSVDLTFIDGMHLVEFALRDFLHAERLSTPTSVVVLDDVLPRSAAEASRDRRTALWAGDTYKITEILERHRPDLAVVPLDTEPTGMLLVLGLDPTSTILADHYDEIVAQHAGDEPLPDEVLHRRTAADPQLVADLPLWEELARARTAGTPPPDLEPLHTLRGTARYEPVEPPDWPWDPTTGG